MDFDADKTVVYWIEGAEYDLGTAGNLLEKKRFPYTLFFGHLALEKLLKAIFVKNTRKHAPATHSLPFLAERCGLAMPEDILTKLREFMEFYFEARYPEEQKSFYAKCTKEYTAQKF